MNNDNLFDQDWRDCLRAHYMHVIREGDSNNEVSLITVLKQTGFNDDDLRDWYITVAAEMGWDVSVNAVSVDAATVEDTPTEMVEDIVIESAIDSGSEIDVIALDGAADFPVESVDSSNESIVPEESRAVAEILDTVEATPADLLEVSVEPPAPLPPLSSKADKADKKSKAKDAPTTKQMSLF